MKKRTIIVAAFLGSLMLGCKGNAKPGGGEHATAKDASAPAPGASDSKDDLPFHKAPPGDDHATERQPPPPSPNRTGDVRETGDDKVRLIASDLVVPGGGTTTATIEVQPKGDWKLNVEYPVRVALQPPTLASPPWLKLDSRAGGTHGVALTTGGLRLDIPFTGDALGSETIEATLRYGVCSKTSCLARRDTVSFDVLVAAP